VVLAEDLRRIQPTMRVLYMSGYTENAVVRSGVIDPQVHFISKPFTGGELTGKIRGVLDSSVRRHTSGQMQSLQDESSPRALSPGCATLPLLPADLLARLLDSVIRARHDEAINVVETIRLTDPELATALRNQVDNFEYESLIEMLGH